MGSHTAYAALSTDDFSSNNISVRYYSSYVADEGEGARTTLATTPEMFPQGDKIGWKQHETFSYSTVPTVYFRDTLVFSKINKGPIVQANSGINLTFYGLYNYVNLTSSGSFSASRPFEAKDCYRYRVYGYNDAGQYTLLTNATVETAPKGDGTYDLYVSTGVVDRDFCRIDVMLYYKFYDAYTLTESIYKNGGNGSLTYYYEQIIGFNDFHMSWSHQSGAEGSLEQLVDIFTDVKDAIINLPTRISVSVTDGLTDLFLPSADSLSTQQAKWDSLLSDRFGALYQVVDLITDFADTFNEREQSHITFPVVSVPLGSVDFVFGGWSVQVVPDGFGKLFAALRMIVSILATILFVNGLKRRFEGLIGGVPNA